LRILSPTTTTSRLEPKREVKTVSTPSQVSWVFPKDLPSPPPITTTLTPKEYPHKLKPVQLFKTVAQCPKPPKTSIFEQQIQQLVKKTDHSLNQAIKQQDFARCMDLKGRLETLRQMAERAGGGEDVSGELEAISAAP
jgi:hypothetical protein